MLVRIHIIINYMCKKKLVVHKYILTKLIIIFEVLCIAINIFITW